MASVFAVIFLYSQDRLIAFHISHYLRGRRARGNGAGSVSGVVMITTWSYSSASQVCKPGFEPVDTQSCSQELAIPFQVELFRWKMYPADAALVVLTRRLFYHLHKANPARVLCEWVPPRRQVFGAFKMVTPANACSARQ
jgi:hypothetical protein